MGQKYLIAFGLLFLGFLLGLFFVCLVNKSKMGDLSVKAEFQKARADELAEKLKKLEEWAKPMLPIFGRFLKE